MYHYPMESQAKMLDALILNRHKLATLAGFPSFAHRALKGTLAETPGKFLIKSVTNEGNISKSFDLDFYVYTCTCMCLSCWKRFNKNPYNTKIIHVHVCGFQSSTVVYNYASSLFSSEMAEDFLNALSERIKPL